MLERQREQFFENPSNRAAFAALEENDYVNGRWNELIELYQKRLTAPDLEKNPAEKIRILLRLAQVLDERCARKDEAFTIYQQILQMTPTNRQALLRLRQIHAERGQWEMVLQMAELAEQSDLPPTERGALHVEMGEIWLDKLHDAEQARTMFERASQDTKVNARALQGLAKSLCHLHREVEAAGVLQQLIDQLGSGPQCAAALVKLAALHEGPLERPSEASALYKRAHTEDPKNLEAIEALTILAMAQNQWDELFDLQERHFQLVTGARMRAAIALEAGLLQLERFGNNTMARHWLERARALTPNDPEVHLAFATLSRTENDPLGQKAALDQLVEVAGASTPTEIILEHASLCAQAGEDEEAIRGLQIALRSWPESRAVLEMLSNLFRRNSRYVELLEILEKRASVPSFSAAERAAILADIGMLHEEQFGDAEQAIDAYERAFLANPSILDIVPALERLYHRSGAWADLRRFLESALAQSSGSNRVALLCSLGEILHEKFNEPERAKALFEEALGLQPDSSRALSGLEHLAIGSGDSETILASFLREAQQCNDSLRLEELIEQIVPLLLGLDRHREALHWLQRVLELNPESRSTLEQVASLQETLGQTNELCETLSKLSARLSGTDLASNQLRRAKLHLALDQKDEAFELFQATLASEPTHPEALEILKQLETLAQEREDFSTLASVQEKLVELLPAEQQLDKLRELATLVTKRIGDTPRALAICRKLRDAGDEKSIPLLEDLLERSCATEELVAHLAWRSNRTQPDSSETLDLDLKRAELLLDPLERFEEAIALYRSIQERDAHSTIRSETAALGLERAARGANDLRLLAEVLADRATREEDPQRKAALALERAILLEDSLQQGDAARAIYSDLCQLQDDPLIAIEAAERLESILERASDWAELAKLLETKLGRGVANEDFELRTRLHALFKERLRRSDKAAENLRQMLVLRPERHELWQELAALFQDEAHAPDLLRTLEDELATQDDGAALDPSRAITLHAQAAALSEKLQNFEHAEQHYQRLLELDPTHSAAIEFLAQRFEAREAWQPLVGVLEKRRTALRANPTPENVERCTALCLRIAELLANKLQDIPAAIATLEASLADTSAILVPAEALAKLYLQQNDELKLLKLCSRVIHEHHIPGELAEWYLRQARTQVRRGEYREASIAFHHALSERPGDPEIEAALRDTYRKLSEATPLAQMLEAQLATLTNPQSGEALPIRLELAELYRSALARPQDALAQLQRVLEMDPSHQNALNDALALGEQLHDHEALLALLEIAERHTRDPKEKAHWLARRAKILAQELGREEAALTVYRDALTLDPHNRATRQVLHAIFEKQQRWNDLLDHLLLDARDAETPTERQQIYERAAEIAWQHLSPKAALPWLTRLRTEQPSDLALLRRIEDLHRQAGHSEALLRTLDAELALSIAPERKLEIHLEQAQLLETKFAAPGRAIHCLESARQAAPDNSIVLRELDRLYETTQRPRERAKILALRVQQAEPEAARNLHLALANLYEKNLQEPLSASQHFFESLRGASGVQRIELLQALGRVLQRTAQPAAWAKVAETELEAFDPKAPVFMERRRELHRSLAEAYENVLGQPERAIQHYTKLLHLAASNEEPFAHDHDTAERNLLNLLRQEGSHAAVATLLQKRVSRGGGTLEEWLELARLDHEKLLAPVRAKSAYQKALERNPDSLEALRGYRAVAEQTRSWVEFAKTLQRELELSPQAPPQERAALWRRLGQVTWQHLGSTTTASQAFAAAIECHPQDLESIRALEQLFETMEDWRSAQNLYQSELDALGDTENERRHAVLVRIAEISATHLRDSENAIRTLDAAQHIQELPVSQQLRLAELYAQQNNLEKFAAAFEVWCDMSDAKAHCEDHLRLARALESLERPNDALARVERALAIDPQNPAAWDAAALLRQERGELDAAAGDYEKAASFLGPDAAATHLIQAADLVAAYDLERAAALLHKAIARDSASAIAHAKLARVALKLERWEQAEHAAGKALDLATAEFSMPQELRLETAFTGANCARQRKRFESAARFYSAALALAPQHPDGLVAYAEVLLALEDPAAASQALETRLAIGDENPDRARHLQLLGQALEAQDKLLAALERYQEALKLDASLQDSHAGTVRILEAQGSTQESVNALLRWSEHSASQAESAAHLIRAAEIELATNDALEHAEQQLRRAQEIDPKNPKAWVLLAELLLQNKQPAPALETANAGLEHAALEARFCARLHLVCAKVLEINGDRSAAAEAYCKATEADHHSSTAALAGARLLRMMGEWRNAASLLENFARDYQGEDKIALAEIHHQLARLQAGPLENLEAAILSYRSALQSHPDLQAAQESLAELLAQRPADWEEAIARHRELLAKNPVRVASLRALIQIALGRRHFQSAENGQAILRALGALAPDDRESAPERIALSLRSSLSMSKAIWENVRQVAIHTRSEIAQARGASENPITPTSATTDPVARFRNALLVAEGELAAPALVPLSTEAVADTLILVSQIAYQADQVSGDGHLVNSLASNLGILRRRKIRKLLDETTPTEIARIDFSAWRSELRQLAIVAALEETDGELYPALAALLQDATDAEASAIRPDTDLTALAATCPEVLDLLRRIYAVWIQTI